MSTVKRIVLLDVLGVSLDPLVGSSVQRLWRVFPIFIASVFYFSKKKKKVVTNNNKIGTNESVINNKVKSELNLDNNNDE